MRKLFIFICMVVAVSLLIGQGLHRIERNTKIYGWLNVQGDLWPIFNGKYDLGKAAYWWDSIYCEDGQFRYILLWSADSTDSAMISPTKLVIDSIVASYYGGMSFFLAGDTLFITDVSGADTFKIYDDGSNTQLQSDNIIVLKAWLYLQTYGFYGYNDTTKYCGTETYRWKEIWALRHMWTSPDKADSNTLSDDGDTTRWNSDNPKLLDKSVRVKDTVFTDYIMGDDNAAPQIGPDGTTQNDSLEIGGGATVIKWIKVGSHFAIILSGSDTLWAAADTTGF